MEASIPKIFVIVVTYKGKQWYDRCFTSLRNSTIPVQTIVVDNASNDGTVEYIKEHYPEIMLIESKENLGFGKGNNLALKYAYEHACDYVFLLNQDAWLDEDNTLEKLVGVAENHHAFGIISPMHLSADKSRLNMALEYNNRQCSSRLLNDLYCGLVKELYETDYVNAAGWLLPRKTLSTLGGFDPLIFHYGEDDDYLNRARYHCLKVGVCPNVRIIHDHESASESDWSRLLAKKSCQEDTEIFLDLNKPFRYHSLRRYYLKKYLKGIFNRNKLEKENARFKFNYLKRMRYAILKSRAANEKKQPNWIQ